MIVGDSIDSLGVANSTGMRRRLHLSLRRLIKERGKTPARLPIILDRPKTRGDCDQGIRPCPFVGCRHHLASESKAGALRLSAANALELSEMSETCSLDVADAGPHSLPEVASLLGVSRQRVSQVEIAALRKLRKELVLRAGQAVAELLPDLFGCDPAEEDDL
jgi:hypothetical protein